LRSSKIMLCVVLICDDESKYSNLPTVGEESKYVIVFEEFMNDPDFYENNNEMCTNLFDYYEYLNSTPASRHLKSIEKLMEERTMFMSKQSYVDATIDRALEIDKLVIATDKLTISYDLAVTRLSKEVKTKTKGNVIYSLTDKGQI